MHKTNNLLSDTSSFFQNLSHKELSQPELFSKESKGISDISLSFPNLDKKEISVDDCLDALDYTQKKLDKNPFKLAIGYASKYKFKNAIQHLKKEVEFESGNEENGFPTPKKFLRNLKRLKLAKKIEKLEKIHKRKSSSFKNKPRIKSEETVQKNKLSNDPFINSKDFFCEPIQEELFDFDRMTPPKKLFIGNDKKIKDDLLTDMKKLSITIDTQLDKNSQWKQKKNNLLDNNLPGVYEPHQFNYNSPKNSNKKIKDCPLAPVFSKRSSFKEQILTKEDANFDFLTVEDKLWSKKMQNNENEINNFLKNVYEDKKDFIEKELENICANNLSDNSTNIRTVNQDYGFDNWNDTLNAEEGSEIKEDDSKINKKISIEALFNKNFFSSEGNENLTNRINLNKKINNRFNIAKRNNVENKILNPNFISGYDEDIHFPFIKPVKFQENLFFEKDKNDDSVKIDKDFDDLLENPFDNKPSSKKKQETDGNYSIKSIKDFGKFIVRQKLKKQKKNFF